MIDELFKFDITNRKTCPDCDHEGNTEESNTSLLVSFEQRAPLEDMLRDTNFAPSTYPDRHCNVCDKYLDTPNVPRLVTGPDVLVMQLVRFTVHRSPGSEKNEAVIPFSDELDLSPYTRGNFALKYRLLSVVQHRGTRARGHYINIAKGRSGEWQKVDDTSASPATASIHSAREMRLRLRHTSYSGLERKEASMMTTFCDRYRLQLTAFYNVLLESTESRIGSCASSENLMLLKR